MSDDELLMLCDSLLSLIRYREARGLSEQTMLDVDELLPHLRRRTDEIERVRRLWALRAEGGEAE